MALTRDEAWAKLTEWTDSEALRTHARSVEIVMRAAAHHYGAGASDEEQWAVAGLLHDADYEKWPEDHPSRTVAWLREIGEERGMVVLGDGGETVGEQDRGDGHDATHGEPSLGGVTW